MKSFFKSFGIFCFIFLNVFYLWNCDLSPSKIVEEKYGLTGKVMDSTGTVINGVKIYCLYHLSHFPLEPQPSSPMLAKESDATKPSELDVIQNFPNPFYNSTFLRIYLSRESRVHISLVSEKEQASYTVFNHTLLNGHYQIFLHSLVDSFQLKNGAYRFIVDAQSVDGETHYRGEVNSLVISDLGAPNLRSDYYGEYFFPYNEALIGKEIRRTYLDPYEVATIVIKNPIYLLFQKEGYENKLIGVNLYPSLLITKDIILKPIGRK